MFSASLFFSAFGINFLNEFLPTKKSNVLVFWKVEIHFFSKIFFTEFVTTISRGGG